MLLLKVSKSITHITKIEFRDGYVNIKEGEMFVVPAGVEHKPKSKKESRDKK